MNPIPKPQEEGNEKDGGKMQPCNDVAGLGDAKGDKDVGDDIDEMGQVRFKIQTFICFVWREWIHCLCYGIQIWTLSFSRLLAV